MPAGARSWNVGDGENSNQLSTCPRTDVCTKPKRYSNGGSSASAQLEHVKSKRSSMGTPSLTHSQPGVPILQLRCRQATHPAPRGGSFLLTFSAALPTCSNDSDAHDRMMLYWCSVSSPELGAILNVSPEKPNGTLVLVVSESAGSTRQLTLAPGALQEPWSTSASSELIRIEPSAILCPAWVDMLTDGMASATTVTGIVNDCGVFRPLRTVTVNRYGCSNDGINENAGS
mmetsp:Transcript_53907/g.125969  ORF Transcript_53907/g.125969 Transcript_53907/m.125969 type:complete len:230 (-) Transcript_53907:1468-2157(-)